MECKLTRLREAIAAGCFAEAGRLLPDYCAALAAALGPLDPRCAEARRLGAQASEFFRWARTMTQCGRASRGAELAETNTLATYLGRSQRTRRTWQLEA